MNHTFVPDEDAGLIHGLVSIKNIQNGAVIMSGRRSSPEVFVRHE